MSRRGLLALITLAWWMWSVLLPALTMAAEGDPDTSTAGVPTTPTGSESSGVPSAGTGTARTAPETAPGADTAGVGTAARSTTPETGTAETGTAKTGTAETGTAGTGIPPVFVLPAPLTIDATDPAGVLVLFEVEAFDDLGKPLPVTCVPPPGSIFPPGTTIVTCQAPDSSGAPSSQSFTVTVNPPPPPEPGAPQAVDDAVETVAGMPVQIAYLANDVDTVGGAVARVTNPPASGTVEPASGLFVYTPKAGFTGVDRFTYELCREALCDPATVMIQVHPAEGSAAVALGDQTWQAISQRPTAGIPNNCKGALAWGGYANGRIPLAAMTSIGGSHLLERQAAEAFLAMRTAAEQTGISLPITDSYRDYDAQVSVRARKGGIVSTATPGTSVHGWAKAIDINLGASPPLKTWLEQNAVRFGWVNPGWARRAGKSFEPWHYEFYGAKPADGGGGCRPATTALTAASPTSGPASELAAPAGSEPAPDSSPIASAPVHFLRRMISVQGLVGVGALGLAGLIARLGVKEFRARREDE